MKLWKVMRKTLKKAALRVKFAILNAVNALTLSKKIGPDVMYLIKHIITEGETEWTMDRFSLR